MQPSDFTRSVLFYAADRGQRLGQAAFNLLPSGAAEAVGGTLFDPFHRVWMMDDLVRWVSDHLIFDDHGLCAVYDGNRILWERP